MGHPANRFSHDKISESVDRSFDLLVHHYMQKFNMSRTEAVNMACDVSATHKERAEKPANMTWSEYYA